MDKVLVGEVLKPHGVQGELKIYPLTHDPHRFSRLKEVILEHNDLVQRCRVMSVRVQTDFVYLNLENIASMDEADRYRGWQVYVDRADVPPLADGWYYFELEGMQVYEGENFLGTITQIVETGANDVYVVKGTRGEICIPALKSVVQKVDVPARRMDVVLPPGLLEDERECRE